MTDSMYSGCQQASQPIFFENLDICTQLVFPTFYMNLTFHSAKS